MQGFRIRANVIAPGLYPSEMTVGATKGLESYEEGKGRAYEESRVMERKNSPAERTGSEEDFAGTVLFMASRAGGYLNGETLLTDGGRLSQLPGTY